MAGGLGDRVEKTFEVKASVAAGASQAVRNWRSRAMVITGTFSATIVIEGSTNGSTWLTIWTVTAPGTYELPDDLAYLRCNTTGYTSGTPEAVCVGWPGA